MFKLKKIFKNQYLFKLLNKPLIYTPNSAVKPLFEYSEKEFWEYRYEEKSNIKKSINKDDLSDSEEIDHWPIISEDWYLSFLEFAHILVPQMNFMDSKILHIGCGLSEVPFFLYELGYKDIINVDFSTNAVEILQKECVERRYSMECYSMDATKMNEFIDEEFDYIIDKGLFDTIACQGDYKIIEYLEEIDRVLDQDGTFFLISHTDRVDLFRLFNWKISEVLIPIDHTSSSKEAIKEKFEGFDREYRLHEKEKTDYEVFKKTENKEKIDPAKEYRDFKSPLIDEIDKLENKLENYEKDYNAKIITLEEFIKLDNLLRYGEKDFSYNTDEEEGYENIEDIKNSDGQMTDLELDICNPKPLTNDRYIAHLRYLLYQEAEDHFWDDAEKVPQELMNEKDTDNEDIEIKEDEELDENDIVDILKVNVESDSENQINNNQENEPYKEIQGEYVEYVDIENYDDYVKNIEMKIHEENKEPQKINSDEENIAKNIICSNDEKVQVTINEENEENNKIDNPEENVKVITNEDNQEHLELNNFDFVEKSNEINNDEEKTYNENEEQTATKDKELNIQKDEKNIEENDEINDDEKNFIENELNKVFDSEDIIKKNFQEIQNIVDSGNLNKSDKEQVKKIEFLQAEILREMAKPYDELLKNNLLDEEEEKEIAEHLILKIMDRWEDEQCSEEIENMEVEEFYYFYSIKKL